MKKLKSETIVLMTLMVLALVGTFVVCGETKVEESCLSVMDHPLGCESCDFLKKLADQCPSHQKERINTYMAAYNHCKMQFCTE